MADGAATMTSGPARAAPAGQRPASAVSVRGVSHVFRSKGRRVLALSQTDLEVREREFLTVVGPSGCGKSTLMNLIVGLYPPTTGQVRWRRAPGAQPPIGTDAAETLPLATSQSDSG